jgi:hypothetical protein
MTSCSQLPASFQSQCGGPTSAYQKNDEGWLVWVGDGNNPGMGITHNLWNAVLPAAQGPYNVQASWGMPILIREDVDPAAPTAATSPKILPLGHALRITGWASRNHSVQEVLSLRPARGCVRSERLEPGPSLVLPGLPLA